MACSMGFIDTRSLSRGSCGSRRNTEPEYYQSFSTLERFFYHSATHILPISESFRRNLNGKGVPPEKMTLQPVWADSDFIKPLPKANKFRSQHGLTDKFILMYAGNIGLTSSLEDVLAAADILREDPDIRFVIIGEGVKKSELQQTAKRKMLGNVIFLPYQPRELFPEMLAAVPNG